MERLPVTWETFVGRRRLSIKDWLASNEIKDYSALVAHLKKRGIAPPALTTVESYFKKPRKPSKAKPASTTVDVSVDKKEEAPQTAKKKRGRRKVHNKQDE